MTRDDYKALFRAVSPGRGLVRDTMKKAEEAERKDKENRRTLRRAWVFALCAVIVAGGAYAAARSSGILGRLYDTPTPEAENAVAYDIAQDEENGISLSLDESLMDGQSCHFAWTVKSSREEDVYYLASYELDDGAEGQVVGGSYGAYGSNDAGDGMLVRLTADAPSYSGFCGNGYETVPEGEIRMRLTVHAYTTNLSAVSVPDLIEILEGGEEKLAEYEQRGELPYDERQLVSLEMYPAVQREIARLMEGGAEYDDAYLAAMVNTGYMTEVATLAVSASISSADAENGYVLPESATFVLPDRTVEVTELKLGIASTTLTYTVTSPDSAPDGHYGAGWWYLLYDQDGQLLNVKYGLGMYSDDATDIDPATGRERVTVTIYVDGNPLGEIPRSIRFVPTCDLPRQEGESSEAYYARMASLADESQCFTLELK